MKEAGLDARLVTARALVLAVKEGRKIPYFDLNLLFRFLPEFDALARQCGQPISELTRADAPILLELMCELATLLVAFPTVRTHTFFGALAVPGSTLGRHPRFDAFILMHTINANMFEAISLFLYAYRSKRMASGRLTLPDVCLALQCFDLKKEALNLYVQRVLMLPLSDFISARAFLLVAQPLPDLVFDDLSAIRSTQASPAAPTLPFLTNAPHKAANNATNISMNHATQSMNHAAFQEDVRGRSLSVTRGLMHPVCPPSSRFDGLQTPLAALTMDQVDLLCINQHVVIQRYLIHMIDHSMPIEEDIVALIMDTHLYHPRLRKRSAALFLRLCTRSPTAMPHSHDSSNPENSHESCVAGHGSASAPAFYTNFESGFWRTATDDTLAAIFSSLALNRDLGLIQACLESPHLQGRMNPSITAALLPQLVKLNGTRTRTGRHFAGQLPPHHAPIDSLLTLDLVSPQFIFRLKRVHKIFHIFQLCSHLQWLDHLARDTLSPTQRDLLKKTLSSYLSTPEVVSLIDQLFSKAS
jgi:hypothetical protein